MSQHQPGILAPLPSQARHLFFSLTSADGLAAALDALAAQADGDALLVGVGASLAQALGARVEGLHAFPPLSGAGVDVPSTQHALWCWLRGDDRGELLHRQRALEAALAPAFRLAQATEAFCYRSGHDLTGYEDGTENPQGEAALAAALAPGGGSFASIQQWAHDLDAFAALPRSTQDHIIGRRLDDNEELDDAPESAHVKRTAQESFTPAAFMMRRSMPWAEGGAAGLMFLCFARTLAPFEVQMRRMAGLDDGIVDGLFRISRPLTGGHYWCPPLRDGRLNLAPLGR